LIFLLAFGYRDTKRDKKTKVFFGAILGFIVAYWNPPEALGVALILGIFYLMFNSRLNICKIKIATSIAVATISAPLIILAPGTRARAEFIEFPTVELAVKNTTISLITYWDLTVGKLMVLVMIFFFFLIGILLFNGQDLRHLGSSDVSSEKQILIKERSSSQFLAGSFALFFFLSFVVNLTISALGSGLSYWGEWHMWGSVPYLCLATVTLGLHLSQMFDFHWVRSHVFTRLVTLIMISIPLFFVANSLQQFDRFSKERLNSWSTGGNAPIGEYPDRSEGSWITPSWELLVEERRKANLD
jgi:hypothetical protein